MQACIVTRIFMSRVTIYFALLSLSLVPILKQDNINFYLIVCLMIKSSLHSDWKTGSTLLLLLALMCI